MDRVISLARDRSLPDGALAELARILAESGATLESRADRADVASTGGPGSLSTLLAPLHLRALGATVATLGVPGRPAGGIDVLATIPGYQSEMSADEAAAALDEEGQVHIAAGTTWTPLDAAFFRYRQLHGAQALPELTMASLLSKKVAMGVRRFGLDVRVAPHGNFGADPVAARRNASRLIAVAAQLDIHATCFLTDARRPAQPFLGRGEALTAIASVVSADGDASTRSRLAEHVADCQLMAARTLDKTDQVTTAALRSAFESLLRAQGTTLASLDERVEAVRAEPRVPIVAERDGFVMYELSVLRDLLVERQRRGDSGADPAGLIGLVEHGAAVERGQAIVSVRVPGGGEDDLVRGVAGAVVVRDQPLAEAFTVEVVRA
jgi:pyrimidine-nucleoside phosphorylase